MPRLAPQCLLKGVIPLPMGFRVKEPGNVVRFRALVRLLKLSPKEVSRATGFSRSYISRVLSCKDDFTGSPAFFRTVEHKLPDVIAGRTSQFFTIPAVSVQRARDVLELLPVE